MGGVTRRRRSTARVLGTVLTIGLYLAVLLAATQVTAGDDSAQGGAWAAGTTVVEQPTAEAAGVTGSESPILTLAVVVGALSVAGMWRLARLARPQQPQPVPARPVPTAAGRRRIPTPG